MITFLIVMGVIFLVSLIALLIGGLYIAFVEWIDDLKYKYRIKHRFDKPPTAKCYCIDCKYHNNKTNRCYRFGETTKEYRCTADNWFCWEAEPCNKEELEEKT